jgi:hypothetical protein
MTFSSRLALGQNTGIGTTAPTHTLHVKPLPSALNPDPLRLEGLQSAAASDSLLTVNSDGVVRKMSSGRLSIAGYWSLRGNAGTDTSIHFIGTTDDRSLLFRVNNQPAGIIQGPNRNMNTIIGYNALPTPTNMTHLNTVVGYQAMRNANSGWANAVVGAEAMFNSSSSSAYNAVLGFRALYSNTSGSSMVAIGIHSLYSNTTSHGNIAIGYNALYNTTTGGNNVGIGYNVMSGNTTGTFNVVVGTDAGTDNVTGSYNTLIGHNAETGAPGLTNATAIGRNAVVGASNSLVLGGTGSSAVNVGIGTATPAHRLHLVGTADPLRIEGLGRSNEDTLLVVNASGVVKKRAMPPSTKIFYPPALAIEISGTATGQTLDLHQQYLNLFGTPAVKSPSAPTAIPTYAETDLYYYITDYDATVFSNVSVSDSGVMSYDIIGIPASQTAFINVVFVVK